MFEKKVFLKSCHIVSMENIYIFIDYDDHSLCYSDNIIEIIFVSRQVIVGLYSEWG